ncbi:hypothetical protein OKW21_003405 [Catalinimonas alkaloidigena]|uniref:FAD-binding oxidoreductase n=1 Tax=Catalinimonas alkaloidigena TaxID=1075417 RepID=UPI00240550C8|nr:FAD-dependent oxidoreductase [Catalinimonas alkaloidigena]MDF9798142.1 hypothetical protein [Catalinimonas alkaloidigena]
MIREVNIDEIQAAPIPWINWRMNQSAGGRRIVPTSLSDLVASVLYAEQREAQIKAVGSSWSFTGAAKPEDFWVDLEQLNRQLPTNMNNLVRPGLDASRYVHVEAGIKLHALNERLWAQGRALHSLGGSQGQSLAGAISTGTHGGDFDRPPLADAVRAIHLVSRGGQEFWLEPEGEHLTTGNTLTIPEWFGGVKIIRENAVFNAALVSMGRCGIVYSYVLEVEEAYYLEEWRYNALWQGQVGGKLEVMRHTLLMASLNGFDNALAGQRSPLGSPNPLHYLQVDIDPNGVEAAYVTKRWATQSSSRIDNPPSKPTTFARDAHWIGWLKTNLGLFPHHVYLDLVRSTFGQQRYPRLVRDRSYYASAGRPDPYPNYQAQMEAMWKDQWRVDSIEFFFDANNPNYLKFIDELKNTWNNSPGRKTGYISLRFMGQSRATMAMQRWSVTVSVECTFFKGFPGNDIGILNALALGTQYGAVFHWGQLTPPGYALQIPNIFGSSLTDWRTAIADLGLIPEGTFSTEFSQKYQFEPIEINAHCASDDNLLLLMG